MSSVISLIALGLLCVVKTVALGPAPVNLGTAGNYAILSETGIPIIPPCIIIGPVGVSPAAGASLTGFSLTLDQSGTFSTSTQVTGKIFAASYMSPTPSILITAFSDLRAAYIDAISRTNANFVNLNGGAIGGLVLVPGLYRWASGIVVGSNVTISGSATDTWIFQIADNFNIAAAKSVLVVGGALAKNIFWVVAGSVTLGPGAHLEGVVLGKIGVTLQTGASVHGRVLSQGFVVLQKATVVTP